MLDFGQEGSGWLFVCLPHLLNIKTDKVIMYFQNKNKGFIQIPILAVAVFLFVVAGTTGGYYVTKQTNEDSEKTIVTISTKEALFKDNNSDILPILRLMKKGMKGEDVCALQEILKLENVFDNKVTCYYGSATHWAVEGFMKKYGYFHTPDKFGTVDEITMNLINQLYMIDKNGSIQKNITTNIKAINNVAEKTPNISIKNKSIEDYKSEAKTSGVIENNSKDYEKRSQEFFDKAGDIVQGLEKDKNSFQLLKDTVDNNRNKTLEHANKIMDSWIKTAEESTLSVPSEYKSSIEATKRWIELDKESLSNSINSFFDIVDLYFTNSSRKDYRDVITAQQNVLLNCMKLDISEGANDKKYTSCELNLVIIQSHSSFNAENFIRITNKLSEIGDIVFDLIEEKASSAEDDIVSELDSISKSIGIMQSIEANYNRANMQAEYKYSMTQQLPSLQNVKCYTTTNDSIFKENRTYNTRCEPYTQTVAEKCALQKARSVSTSGIYIGGLVDPKCQ